MFNSIIRWQMRCRHGKCMADGGGSGPSLSGSADTLMLNWTLTFLVIALIAAVLGFWGLEGIAMQLARICFVLFLVFFVVSLLFGRRPPVV